MSIKRTSRQWFVYTLFLVHANSFAVKQSMQRLFLPVSR